jgi:hypothetical protein
VSIPVPYVGGGRLVIDVHPKALRKNGDAIRYVRGRPTPIPRKLPRGVLLAITDAAFDAGIEPVSGPVVLGVVAYWPRKWGAKGRAPGRACGDVDAIVAGLLDALAGTLYRDDAQVALLVAANAYDPKRPRIEVVARPLDQPHLAGISDALGLPFDTARLSLPTQGKLIP